MPNKTFEKYYGLEWLSVSLPIRKTKHGDIVDVDAAEVEKAVARLIVEARVPIRGIEAKLLRKFAGLSCERFGREIESASSTVFKWEKEPERRIGFHNEITVRVWAAEKFNVSIPGKLSALTGVEPDHTLALDLGKTACR